MRYAAFGPGLFAEVLLFHLVTQCRPHDTLVTVSQRLPEEMRRLSRVLMAGEQVVVMEKPDTKTILMWEAVTGVGVFIVLFIFVSLFGGLPVGMTCATAVVFAIASGGVLHFFMATTTYVITDKRLLVVNDLGSELKEFCDVEEVTQLRKIRFGHQLVVERTSGNPIRLFGLKNRDEVGEVLIGS
jgi:hypothetical protein